MYDQVHWQVWVLVISVHGLLRAPVQTPSTYACTLLCGPNALRMWCPPAQVLADREQRCLRLQPAVQGQLGVKEAARVRAMGAQLVHALNPHPVRLSSRRDEERTRAISIVLGPGGERGKNTRVTLAQTPEHAVHDGQAVQCSNSCL